MPIDFGDMVYTSTDGSVKIPMADLPMATLFNAFRRTADHVYGNESISKGSTARAKDASLSDADYNAIIAEARNKYLGEMMAGTWGEKGVRGPRMPAANRLEAIRNVLLANDTIAMIKQKGFVETETKGTWLAPNGTVTYTLAQLMAAYESNPQLGAERTASLDRRANAKLEAEKREAEERKAAKAREAGVAVTADADELVI